jgi:GNAT superfamily N-acetyltransferase
VGRDVIQIRTMTRRDLPLGVRLTRQAGWNQTASDWRRFLHLEPAGCWVALWDGQPAGTAVTSVFDSIAWIAMILVDRKLRGRGIGTRLVEQALAYLEGRRAASIRLDATPLGRPIYEKLGFSPQYELARWEGVGRHVLCHPRVAPIAPGELPAVIEFDRRIAGTHRPKLLEYLHRHNPRRTCVFRDGEQLVGYATCREGARAVQIGPAAALEPEAGRALADAMLQSSPGHPVYVDIPCDNGPATRWAEDQGFTVQRHFTRMGRGPMVADLPGSIWASSGPEAG